MTAPIPHCHSSPENQGNATGHSRTCTYHVNNRSVPTRDGSPSTPRRNPLGVVWWSPNIPSPVPVRGMKNVFFSFSPFHQGSGEGGAERLLGVPHSRERFSWSMVNPRTLGGWKSSAASTNDKLLIQAKVRPPRSKRAHLRQGRKDRVCRRPLGHRHQSRPPSCFHRRCLATLSAHSPSVFLNPARASH